MNRIDLINCSRIGAAAVCLAGMFAAAVTLADKPYKYANLETDDPAFIDQNDALKATAKVKGLSHEHGVKVVVHATAEVEVACVTPSGKNKPPGAQPEPFLTKVSGSAYHSKDTIEDGRLTVEVETKSVGSEIAGAPDCPNPNWTETIERVSFLDATFLVHQKGKMLEVLLCSFDPPTKDGKILGDHVDCDDLYY